MNNGISVIIPVYNRELFIKEAIQSFLSQDYEGIIEVLISDDGSTDRSLIIAESFGEKVKILRKPKNCLTQGVSSTRNRGLRDDPYFQTRCVIFDVLTQTFCMNLSIQAYEIELQHF